jgi:hypothetical protein
VASIVAYHGVTASDHQARFDQLAAQGFRPLSLNVSGDPGDARYAAVWIERPGVEWVAMHGVDAATYQARFDELVAHGLSPSIVSATGPAGSASFTALFERVPRRWFARHNLRWVPTPIPTPSPTRTDGQRGLPPAVPERLRGPCRPALRRHLGGQRAHHAVVLVVDQRRRLPTVLRRAGAGWHPSGVVAPAPNGRTSPAYRDEPIGEWAARHGLDGNQYQAEFDQEVGQGCGPRSSRPAVPEVARHAPLFVRDDTPWPAVDRDRRRLLGDADLDDGARHHAGQLHPRRERGRRPNGTLVANRGYTWAEDGYAITQPNTLFRLASVSKLFASAALES